MTGTRRTRPRPAALPRWRAAVTAAAHVSCGHRHNQSARRMTGAASGRVSTFAAVFPSTTVSAEPGETRSRARTGPNGSRLMDARVVLLTVLSLLMAACGREAKPLVRVSKSPTCTCCQGWIDYLEASGFQVEVAVTKDLALVKDQQGIPPRHASCHTAVMAGYVIEGHVPAEDLRRLLRERPPIRGLLLPGTPVGAPGLEGVTEKSYAVLALDAAGGTRVFATHPPAFLPTWQSGRSAP